KDHRRDPPTNRLSNRRCFACRARVSRAELVRGNPSGLPRTRPLTPCARGAPRSAAQSALWLVPGRRGFATQPITRKYPEDTVASYYAAMAIEQTAREYLHVTVAFASLDSLAIRPTDSVHSGSD